MSLNDFKKNKRLCGEAKINAAATGLTLIEVLVTLVIAVVLGATIMRFYKDSYRSYSLQEQITDRNQNAHYVLNRMVEILQQAGSGLPDSGWKSIIISGDTLTMGSNPKDGNQYYTTGLTGKIIDVSDTVSFNVSKNALLTSYYVLIDYAAVGVATEKVKIDVSQDTAPWKLGRNNSVGTGQVYLTQTVTLNSGDRVYAYREDSYFVTGGTVSPGKFTIRPHGDATLDMVLAEGLDSVGFTFLKPDGVTKTTDWSTMRSARISVRARTEKADPKLPAPGYRKITLPMNVLFKNKV